MSLSVGEALPEHPGYSGGAARQGQQQCATCHDWSWNRVLLAEIDADGNITRRDEPAWPLECPNRGWSRVVYMVEVQEVRDWDSVGKHGCG